MRPDVFWLYSLRVRPLMWHEIAWGKEHDDAMPLYDPLYKAKLDKVEYRDLMMARPRN